MPTHLRGRADLQGQPQGWAQVPADRGEIIFNDRHHQSSPLPLFAEQFLTRLAVPGLNLVEGQ
jgi:hypothetical protein